jgi:methanogenic corrinoid protein MtbC1
MATDDEFTVPRHPIAVVADRTQLSQDVLRVWERRYRAVEPGRSDGGQRLYSDADIERLRLLSVATRMGRPIRLVAVLPTPDLARMVREDEQSRGVATSGGRAVAPAEEIIEPALALTIALDAPGLESLLRRALLAVGLNGFLESVAAPLLVRIGEGWQAGRLAPSHEHLATAIVHRVITGALQTVAAPSDAASLVVATPAGERHEMGALLVAATAAAEGWRVTYLGADLPAADIVDAAVRTNARMVALSVMFVADSSALIDEVRLIRGELPASIPVLVGGRGAGAIGSELSAVGIQLLGDLAELREVLRSSDA